MRYAYPWPIRHTRNMEQYPSNLLPPYRLVVKVRPSSRPGAYIWEIVYDDREGISTVWQASVRTFTTREEAYTQGAAVLNWSRDMTA
jgi:hypothetical protein